MKSLKEKILLGALIAGIGAFCPTQAISQVNLEDKVSSEVVSRESAENSPSYYVNSPKKPVAEQSTGLKSITGVIKAIDEDEIPILTTVLTRDYSGKGTFSPESGLFQLEHMRIYSESDKKTYKLIFPGPSNYQVGDKVTFRYEPKTILSFDELVQQYSKSEMNNPVQRGYFNLDGLIRRGDEGL
jgi:hypothetical protein